MNLEIDGFLVVFIIMLIILSIVYPVTGNLQQKKLKKSKTEGAYSKIKWYRESILWAWIPVLLILALMPLSDLRLNNIGFKWINTAATSLNKWIVYSISGLYILYLLYNIYSLVILKFNKKSRSVTAAGIPEEFRLFLPVTRKEKSIWDFVALSAGITEEVIYRGYLFYALGRVFPDLSLILILLISTFLFGIGHIYQGKEAIRPTILGFVYGVFYIVFDSVIPLIIIHVAQDLIVRNILDEDEAC